MTSTAVDFSKLNVSHSELQKYLDDVREAEERAKQAEIQDQLDRISFEREARIEAVRRAEAEARAAGDPNIRAARVVAELVGDRWGELVVALSRVNPSKFVNELLRLNSERTGLAHHQATMAAPQARADAKANAEAVRKAIVESELGKLGITDVTPDEDPV